ncbi:MAG: MarR family winged helix-turn-helix transcriptional regulator, partial [Sphingomonas sp.]
LRRTPDPSDRRVKRIAITAEGEAAVAATEPLRVQLIDQLFGALDDGEQQQFAAMLDKLATRMDELEG